MNRTSHINAQEIEEKFKNIVFYDGDCGFCNRNVQFILKHRKEEFHFVPLQSNLAKKILDQYEVDILLNTLYFLSKGKLYEKSTAALQIARKLKGAYPVFFYIGSVVPKLVRDWFYDQIAKKRHRIQKDFCVLPREDETDFFLSED